MDVRWSRNKFKFIRARNEEMNTEASENSKIVNLIFKIAGAVMESRFRYRFSSPMKILRGADIQPGQAVLEVGCGTGFYTVSAAQLIGDQGYLVAIDASAVFIERVSKKVQTADLKNVRVVKGDAMDMGLDAESIDTVLLFSVIPSPTLPLNRFLPEMHRVLKPEGTLAVTTFPWVLPSIRRSGLFTYASKRNRVYNFRRC
jgi:demethylmenaquinone methyltransferase/2-methoxy-6-polyprenyl-1,4-benzoquinol methylase